MNIFYDLKKTVDKISEVGEFVSFMNPDKTYQDSDLYQTLPAKFAQLFYSDNVNTKIFPILIYEYQRRPVAWWNCRKLCGCYLPPKK